MQKLVSLDDIELNVSAADWQDAVEKSGTILVNNGYVYYVKNEVSVI